MIKVYNKYIVKNNDEKNKKIKKNNKKICIFCNGDLTYKYCQYCEITKYITKEYLFINIPIILNN